MDGAAAGRQTRRTEDREHHLDDERAAVAKKNELRPHLSKYWKIPPDGDAAFVAAMEDVLAVYRLAHDPRFPVICMDESSKQLISEVRAPIPAAPGHGQIVDHEYVRHGVATLFVEVEPLAGRRHVEVTERRTRQDWAHFIKAMLDERYPAALKVRLVMDNLNTHDLASLYETFPPAEARRLADRLEIHHTPKHGSWLNIAENELSSLTRQCVSGRRFGTLTKLQSELAAWSTDVNTTQRGVDWQMKIQDARGKLKSLYPKIRV